MIVARSLTTVWSRGDAYHVRLRDSLALFVHLTCLLLFHSHHWPIPQSLPSKYVQNQMPIVYIDTYSNSTILIVQLSDGGATGGTNLSGGAAAPLAPHVEPPLYKCAWHIVNCSAWWRHRWRIVLSRWITFIAYQTQQLRDVEELDISGTLATTGPAMIIRSLIRIRH